MTTVVQTRYRGTLVPGFAGMIADMASSEVGTRLCETAAGIGFGLAVSQGVGDKGVVIGGAAFLGISVRDVTLDGAPIDPLGDVRATVDTYPQNSNMGVLTRGHIWVEAQGNVVAGNALSFDGTTGKFTTGTSGASARGYIDFTSQPVDGNTIVINAKTITFKTSGASGLQSNIGPTLNDTITALAAVLNGSIDASISTQTYLADGARLWIAEDAAGVAGNAIAITAGTTPGATASGATLAGGSASSTAVTSGFWLTSAIGGQLAKVSLGIQR